jgi:hypothetical protein
MVQYPADVLEANHNSIHFSQKILLTRADTSMKGILEETALWQLCPR